MYISNCTTWCIIFPSTQTCALITSTEYVYVGILKNTINYLPGGLLTASFVFHGIGNVIVVPRFNELYFNSFSPKRIIDYKVAVPHTTK